MTFNTDFQQTVIPIGRHSLMSGYRLEHRHIQDPAKIQSFFEGLKGWIGRMNILHEWSTIVIKDNIAALGYAGDVRLIDYLGDVSGILEKSTAFVRMVAYFNRRAREADVS